MSATPTIPVAIEDEKTAILSLLGLQAAAPSAASNDPPSTTRTRVKAEDHDNHDNVSNEDDVDDDGEDSVVGVTSPVSRPPLFEDEDDSEEEEASSPCARRPQMITPTPDQKRKIRAVGPVGASLRKIGKKRKHHATMDGQFEDANESSSSSSPLIISSSAPPPPPPHLIQQSSNEYSFPPPPTTTLQSQTSAELARRALAFSTLQGLPPQLAAAMMGVDGSASTREDDTTRQKRMQLEALLFQAQMQAVARQQNSDVTGAACSLVGGIGCGGAAGIPSHLAALRGAWWETVQEQGNELSSSSSSNNKKEQESGASAGPPAVVPVIHPSAPLIATACSEPLDIDEVLGKDRMSTKFRFEKYKPPETWRMLTQAPKMRPTPADKKFENPVLLPEEHDVLMGRGGLTNTNPGNIRFRNLISSHRIHYCTAPKGDKGALARYICNYVRAMGGRFLAKDPSNPKSEAWYEVGDDKAVMKCGQALREGTAEFNRKQEEYIQKATRKPSVPRVLTTSRSSASKKTNNK